MKLRFHLKSTLPFISVLILAACGGGGGGGGGVEVTSAGGGYGTTSRIQPQLFLAAIYILKRFAVTSMMIMISLVLKE